LPRIAQRLPFCISWQSDILIFSIDDSVVFQTFICTREPIGVVIWLDNQYAAWTPDGKISLGTLLNKTSTWIEVTDIEIDKT